MNKSYALLCLVGALTLPAVACSDKPSPSQPACETGSEACQCFSNNTCADGLTCFAKLCLDLSAGFGGTTSVPGAAGDGAGGEAAGAPGSAGEGATGGAAPAGGSNAGSGGTVISNGGKGGLNGGGRGGAGGNGGDGGNGSDPFPPNPAGCALVSNCPACCDTTGVFALDALDRDATRLYVKAFDVTASSATAEFDFQTSGEVGAIFFRFSTPQDIGALSIAGLGTGAALEIALVRQSGQDGCIYPVVGGSLSSTPSTCWGLGAGPYAALPADQIEVRVRSTSAGRAAINVSSVEYGP